MALPTLAIETAAMSRMRGDTTLQGLLTGSAAPLWSIFGLDGVPINQPFPYIAAGVPITQTGSAETMSTPGRDAFLQVSVLTQAGASGGFAQAWAIANRIDDLFNRKALDLSASGFSNFFLMLENALEQPQADGITQHIPMRFKLMTQG
jgi:Protein of unknown function (DUF3168)